MNSTTKRVGLVILIGLTVQVVQIGIWQNSHILKAQSRKEWEARLVATSDFMQTKMWNAATGNYVRRTDAPIEVQKSDAWGITIVLDAFSYMVQSGMMKPLDLRRYYESSTALYERTDQGRGARIMDRQGDQIYVGGDDDLQWICALCDCFEATKDSVYLFSAEGAFNGLISLGFWNANYSPQKPSGWAWNSNDPRPMGVSTSYGALAAARLLRITGLPEYRAWAQGALRALQKKQISFIPRDEMIAAEAACIMYDLTHEDRFLSFAVSLAKDAVPTIDGVMSGKLSGEHNPTDVGDLAEGLYKLGDETGKKTYNAKATELVNFFFKGRSNDDIKANGFYSRYDVDGEPLLQGRYLGVPITAGYLPEEAEMLKLCAIEALRQK